MVVVVHYAEQRRALDLDDEIELRGARAHREHGLLQGGAGPHVVINDDDARADRRP